jgi:protein-S-isoprenylcysteine O-methyltransferase Ste14
MTNQAKWTNVVLRELAWLAAFLFWAYYRKPADTSLFQIRLDPRGIIGLSLVAAGIALHLWSAIVLADNITNPAGLSGVIAKDGPYNYVRNPIYIAGAIIFIGIYLMYAEFRRVDLIATVMVGLLLQFYVVRVEEPATMKRLGEEYAEYRRRVPRWLPGIWFL